LVERMNRTLLDDRFRVEGRKTWYVAIEGIQRDLNPFLAYYNFRRSHRGYRLAGRIPAQTLRQALGREELPTLDFIDTQSAEEAADIAQLTA